MINTTIPALSACRFEVPELPPPSELAQMNASVSPEREARICAAAASTVICWHPEADDCFNVAGMGKTKQEAYGNMLEQLYCHYADGLETDEEADDFYGRIKEILE